MSDRRSIGRGTNGERRGRDRSYASYAWACVLLAFASPVGAADIAAGATLYRAHCETCHGARGAGGFPGTTAFSRGNGLMRTDAEIVASLQRGGASKPSYFGIMTEAQLYDLVGFLRTLQ